MGFLVGVRSADVEGTKRSPKGDDFFGSRFRPLVGVSVTTTLFVASF